MRAQEIFFLPISILSSGGVYDANWNIEDYTTVDNGYLTG
jgi:hypothetical protein